MMLEEFEQRTGIFPSLEEYAEIERVYCDFDGDKDEFCKAYKENQNFLAQRIQHAIDMKHVNARTEAEAAQRKKDEAHAAEVAELKKQVAKLQAELDKELEWQPSKGTGTNVEQRDYEHLAQCGHVMTDDEARQLIADEFGFSPEKIEIVTTVHTYEVNKHRRLRKAAEYTRPPVYDATDWNYIRFNVRGYAATWCYEMVNADLLQYCT